MFFRDVKEKIEKNSLTQIAWGKDANKAIGHEENESENELEWFFRYRGK